MTLVMLQEETDLPATTLISITPPTPLPSPGEQDKVPHNRGEDAERRRRAQDGGHEDAQETLADSTCPEKDKLQDSSVANVKGEDEHTACDDIKEGEGVSSCQRQVEMEIHTANRET